MNKKVSIYIVEDYLLARVTCRKALEQFDDLEIKNDFETAEECIKTLPCLSLFLAVKCWHT